MTRDELLDQYRSIRAAVQRILQAAARTPRKSDFERVFSEIAPWADEDLIEGEVFNMFMDLALFEPDPRGRRNFDVFLTRDGRRLPADDRAVAERMTTAFFSLFRVGERHEVAGVWLEDVLTDDRRIWLVDEELEASARPDDIISLRIFDAGSFHAAFGIVTEPGDETLGPCLAAKVRRVPLPMHTSLAAQAYADHLAVEAPMNDEENEFIEEFAAFIEAESARSIEHEKPAAVRAKPKQRLPKPRKT